MAIAGSMVNCVRCRLIDGKLFVGLNERANKSIVEEDPKVVAERLLKGEDTVRLFYYGENVSQLKEFFGQ